MSPYSDHQSHGMDIWLRSIFFFFFCPFRVIPVAYGNSQARGQIGAAVASLPYSHSGIWAVSVTYTTDHSNTESLTHWLRPGMEPASSWILLGFVTTEPQWELYISLWLPITLHWEVCFYLFFLHLRKGSSVVEKLILQKHLFWKG